MKKRNDENKDEDEGASPPPRPDDYQRGGAKDPRLGRIHDRVLDALSQVEAGIPADKALRQVFSKSKDLGPSERGKVGDRLYGYLRHALRARDLLERAAKAERRPLELIEPPIMTRLRLLTHMAAEGVTLEALTQLDPYAIKRLPGVIGRVTTGRLAPSTRDPIERMSIDLGLPVFVCRRLIEREGEAGAEALARALLGRAPATLRVNRVTCTREQAQARILSELGVQTAPTRLSPDGLILPEPIGLRGEAIFEDGWVEPQDEGSQLVALATGAKPGTAVLDACAGAGGKTLAIGALMAGKGRLLAIDPDEKKLVELKKRLRRGQVPNGETRALDLLHGDTELLGRFEVVLVDAPCTGTGTLRRNPDLAIRLAESDLEHHLTLQKRLLPAAIGALTPGGRLLYATCSILRAENEDMIASLLAADPRVRPLELSTTLGPELAKALGASYQARIGPGPDAQGPDGFYLALLERCG